MPDNHRQLQNEHPNIKKSSYRPYQNDEKQLKNVDTLLFDLLRSNEPEIKKTRVPSARIPHINQNNNYQQLQRMRDSRDNHIPKMGQIYEDGGEDYEGTYKNNQRKQYNGIQLPNDMRRLDTADIALH